MKVRELVEKLNALNPELEVYCCTDEDNVGFSKNQNIRAMPVRDPYELSANIFREPSGELVLQLEVAESPRKVAVVDFGLDVR